jgi:hypothetical protein
VFADRMSASRRPALVFGPEVDRGGGWDVAVALAEKLRAAVYGAPLLDRASSPRYATWGAFPGHTLDAIQSGIGVVHNALLLEDAERSVVEGPFRPAPRSLLHGEWAISPKPPWFVDNRTAATTGRRLASFATRPRVSALPGVFASALRG